MNFATNIYGLVALAIVGIAFQMARKNTAPGQKPKDIVVRFGLFVAGFCVLVYVVPIMFNTAVVHVYNQTQSSAAGQILGATLENSAGMVQSVIGSDVAMPETETVDAVVPKVEALAPAAPRREPQVELVTPVQRAAFPTAAPVFGPAPASDYAPLGTNNGSVIQGPAPASWLESPTIKAISAPNGGPSANDAEAAWQASPTVQVIQKYTVKRGDTMHKIAQRLYGDGGKWVAICKANPMRDCNDLRAGMVLNLP